MLGVLFLSGCNRLGAGIITGEAPTASQQQIQTVTPPTIPVTASPDHVYPPPITETTAAPTGGTGPYPLPIDATQPVVSSTQTPTLPGVNNNTTNPYPLQETPAEQQVGLSTPFPYPPPTESAPLVTRTTAVPGASPTGATPNLPVTPVATPTAGLTPQATVVKTWFVATDPTTVNLEAGRPQLVVFFAEWCTLCRSIAPVILNLDSQYSDRMNFIYLDTDDEETKPFQTKLKYTIIGRPRIYLIDGLGTILRDWTGYVSLEELQQAITSFTTIPPATTMPPTMAPEPTKHP